MCIGNTTSPAANSTVNWYPREEERVTTLQETPGTKEVSRGPGESAASANKKRNDLKAGPKSQSSRTSGGTY